MWFCELPVAIALFGDEIFSVLIAIGGHEVDGTDISTITISSSLIVVPSTKLYFPGI